jgi:Spy/CpxP family protein refolding chaperone
MKTVTLTTTLILLLAAFANCVHAQERLEEFMNETTPEERAKLQTDYMKESLALTSEQETKIHDLNLTYAKKMQDTYNTPDRKLQKLKKMKGISTEKDREIKEVLNPEQYATYQKNKEEMKEKIRARVQERRKEK